SRPAGGDHRVFPADGQDGVPLHIQKRLYSKSADQLLEGLLVLPLNEQVAVHKPHAQRFCQNHAHGAFSAPGHSGQNDVAQMPLPPRFFHKISSALDPPSPYSNTRSWFSSAASP